MKTLQVQDEATTNVGLEVLYTNPDGSLLAVGGVFFVLCPNDQVPELRQTLLGTLVPEAVPDAPPE